VGDLETVPPPVRREAIGGKERLLRLRKKSGALEMKK